MASIRDITRFAPVIPENSPDRPTDGKLMDAYGRLHSPTTPISAMPAYQPNNGTPALADNPRVQVNGIWTDAHSQQLAAQDLANATGQPVVALRNANNGYVADLFESGFGKFGLSTVPGMALADVIESQLKQGKSITLDVHSQGGIVASEALSDVAGRLRNSGMSNAEVREALGKVHVNTYGAAAEHYIQGPEYQHHANGFDPVPGLFGLTNAFNPGVNRFNKLALNPHDFSLYMEQVYGPHTAPQLHPDPQSIPTLPAPSRFDQAFNPPTPSFGFGPHGVPEHIAASAPAIPLLPSAQRNQIEQAFAPRTPSFGFGPHGAPDPLPPSIDPTRGFMQAPPIGGQSLDPKYGFNPPTAWTPPPIAPPPVGDIYSIGSTPMPANPSASNVGTIGGSALTNFGLQGPVAPPLSSGSSLSSYGISGIGMSGLSPGGFGQFGGSPIGGGSWSSNTSGSTSSSTSSTSSTSSSD